jgi:hypothetical protein
MEKILLECHSVRDESQMTSLRTEHVNPQRVYTRHNTSIYTEYLPGMELHLKICYKTTYTHFGIVCSINLGILLS